MTIDGRLFMRTE
jgi:hypothetical protein